MDSPSNSNSSSSTPPDTPAEPAGAPALDEGRSKRFDFLLKQTEVFSHFMGGTGKSAKSPLKMKQQKPAKKSKNAKEGKKNSPIFFNLNFRAENLEKSRRWIWHKNS